jgi:hypothetical protein
MKEVMDSLTSIKLKDSVAKEATAIAVPNNKKIK